MTRQKYKANSFRVDAATIILQLNLGWGLYRVSYLLAISLVYASDNFARESLTRQREDWLAVGSTLTT